MKFQVRIAPHPSDHDQITWFKTMSVSVLPTLGSFIGLSRSENDIESGHVSDHDFDYRNEIEEIYILVKVDLTSEEIEAICCANEDWSEFTG